ncbi:HBL273Wp [Eremothecium sinecaudum]|uniref:HBL273Wp n=1 Tax=Eremothecium sinecaudum TaxID=45286 RepID=A0A120K0R9_9SACH|nr:HBL273Wp [Eremothecium sinecaudum]AMD18629.1 HBL273Wp [Eremothecium sinecaudum]
MAPEGSYLPHVSFEDLSPSVVDEEVTKMRKQGYALDFSSPFIHVPPQFNPLYLSVPYMQSERDANEVSVAKHPVDLDIAYAPQVQQEVVEAYTHMLEGGLGIEATRRSLSYLGGSSRSNSSTRAPTHSHTAKLPPPPEVSILRNKDIDEHIDDFDITDIDVKIERQLDLITKSNTEKNSGFRAGYTTAGFNNIHEVEDRLMARRGKQTMETAPDGKLPTLRKKSYAEMTDEELKELEDSLAPRSKSFDLDLFDFSQQSSLYLGTDTKRDDLRQKVNLFPAPCMYRSRPSVPYRAVSCTKVHSAFHSYVSSHAKDGSEEMLRTVLCYISGRKHTWSAVDWYIHQVAMDGDHLVIATWLPEYNEGASKLPEAPKSRRSSTTQGKFRPTGLSPICSNSIPESAQVEHNDGMAFSAFELDEYAKERCKSLLDYYAQKCKHRILKITVEFIKENSKKKSMAQVVEVYKPHLQLISTVSININTKLCNGKVKLPNYIVKHLPIPTMVVPNEFLRLEDIGVAKKSSPIVSQGVQLDRLNEIITATSRNPFAFEPGRDNHGQSQSYENSDSESITAYFPKSDEWHPKREQFDLLGYIPPSPTFASFCQDSSGGSSRSSRRSSRVAFTRPNIYKVKSLITESELSNYTLKQNKASQQAQPIRSRKLKPSHSISIPTRPDIVSLGSSNSEEKRTKKGRIGGFFKKFGFS